VIYNDSDIVCERSVIIGASYKLLVIDLFRHDGQ